MVQCNNLISTARKSETAPIACSYTPTTKNTITLLIINSSHAITPQISLLRAILTITVLLQIVTCLSNQHITTSTLAIIIQ